MCKLLDLKSPWYQSDIAGISEPKALISKTHFFLKEMKLCQQNVSVTF